MIFPEEVRAGALMSYSADHQELYGRVAVYVDMILEGCETRGVAG